MFLHQSKYKFLKIKSETLFIEHEHVQIKILIEIND